MLKFFKNISSAFWFAFISTKDKELQQIMNILVTSGIKGIQLSDEEALQLAEALDKDIYPNYAKHMSVAFFVECVETMGETLTKQRMKHGN